MIIEWGWRLRRVHTCGCRVWVDERWNGLDYVAEYYDEDGNRIYECPCCGETIFKRDLKRVLE